MRQYMKHKLSKLAALGLSLIATSSQASILFNPSITGAEKRSISILAANTKVDYRLSGSSSLSLDSDTVGVSYQSSLSSDDGYAFQFAYHDSSFSECSSNGFNLGAGYKRQVIREGALRFGAFAALDHSQFDSGSCLDEVRLRNANVTNIHIGPTVVFKEQANWDLYSTLDMTLFSQGKLGSSSFKQDDRATVKIGGRYKSGEYTMRGELALLGESSITLAVGKAI